MGRALVNAAQGQFVVFPTDIRDLDITQKDKVKEKVLGVAPEIIIHAAAYTDVDGCEKRPDVCAKVNVEGTRNISEAAAQANAALIYISTDYVFDGTQKTPYREEDAVSPISAYGRAKADAEKIVSALKRYLIIRSSFLFGLGKRGFVEAILEQANKNKTVKVVCDKYGTPTYVNDLAQALLIICAQLPGGILNITNSGYCSWIEYAQKIVEFAKIKGVTFLPLRLRDYPFIARRPAFSVLDNSRLRGLIGQPLRPWQEALKEYVECLTR